MIHTTSRLNLILPFYLFHLADLAYQKYVTLLFAQQLYQDEDG